MPSFSPTVNNAAVPGLRLMESESVAIADGWKDASSAAGMVACPAEAGTRQSTALGLVNAGGSCGYNCTVTKSAPE